MVLAWCLAMAVAVDGRPAVTDLARFPPPVVVEQELLANLDYRRHAAARGAADPTRAAEWNRVLAETDLIHAAWYALRWAHMYEDRDQRADALARLRDYLGPEAYYAGQMPPGVPVWRLVPVD